MNTDEILNELRDSEGIGRLHVFRNLITRGPSDYRSLSKTDVPLERTKWKPISIELLKILTNNEEFDKEQILLTSHAFMLVLCRLYDIDTLKITFGSYFHLQDQKLISFDETFHVRDTNLFQLWIAHGYLQVNRDEIYVADLCELPFEVLYQNCIRYTSYTHLAFKILEAWLERTEKCNYWTNNDPRIEKLLEMIIYSNWNNSIKEVSKQNSTAIFNQYLRITGQKYNGFLEFSFEHCVNNLSWQNETKYTMLIEICNNLVNLEPIARPDFISCIFISLTKSYLRSSGLKLYNIISNKLTDEQWKRAFGPPIRSILAQWGFGSRKNEEAIQLLCTQWLESTINKRRFALAFLWELSNDTREILFRSNLERIASQFGVNLEGGNAEQRMDDANEYIRLNSFAAHCHRFTRVENDSDLETHFHAVKRFLFYNVTTNSPFLRRGILKYFKIWFLNFLKACVVQRHGVDQMTRIFDWLHKFLLDCFEIGSCYQRRILGVKLYETILFYTNERPLDEALKNDRRFKDDLNNGFNVAKELKISETWSFTSKESLLWLFKLILDPANDVRDVSTEMILQHFPEDSLNSFEKQALLSVAVTKLNSSKFYEAENGASLVKILCEWFPISEIVANRNNVSTNKFSESLELYESIRTHETYAGYLLHEARYQIETVKRDILRAATTNSPFHGTLTAIMAICFGNGPNKDASTSQFVENLTELLEDAVNHLLSRLSLKSDFERGISSSFAEMGFAIDETVKGSEIATEFNNITLSPAHQVVITCIWTSLKISCDLASEIGIAGYSDQLIERSANLIITVLTKCRHKGAIEAAGLAIGRLTRKLVTVRKYSELPKNWLRDLIHGSKNNPNITRRSAGLSIMFHQIVANDHRHGKPLVHFAIQDLLELLQRTDEELDINGENFARIEESEKDDAHDDLPRARYLHFVQRLVADSELHAQVVPYLEEITIQCFTYLQSRVWSVRNASLQLFGAIVPRITGQYTGGKILEFGNGYSVDHFVTHYPSLASRVLFELTNAARSKTSFDEELRSHAAVVRSLILLSRMSTGGSDFVDYSSKTYIVRARLALESLFDSPIAHVRILAAKAYAALVAYPRLAIESEALRRTIERIESRNSVHGHLSALAYINMRLESEIAISNPRFIADPTSANDTSSVYPSDSEVRDSKRLVSTNYATKSNHCYVVEAMRMALFDPFDSRNASKTLVFDDVIPKIDVTLDKERCKPGFVDYVEKLTTLYAKFANRAGTIEASVALMILNSRCVDQTVSFLNHLEVYDETIRYRACEMLSSRDKAVSEASLGYLNRFLNSVSNADEKAAHFRRVLATAPTSSKSEHLRYTAIPTLDRDANSIGDTLSYTRDKCLDNDEAVRMLAVEGLPNLFHNFAKARDSQKLDILGSALALLKDEVDEVRESTRNTVAQFLGDFDESLLSATTEAIYYRIFDLIASRIVSDDELARFFSNRLGSMNRSRYSDSAVESPFDHEDDATVAENTKFLNIMFHTLSQLGRVRNYSSSDSFSDETSDAIIRAREDIQARMEIDCSDVKAFLELCQGDYLERKRSIVVFLCQQFV